MGAGLQSEGWVAILLREMVVQRLKESKEEVIWDRIWKWGLGGGG